jgi:hypothetical protein
VSFEYTLKGGNACEFLWHDQRVGDAKQQNCVQKEGGKAENLRTSFGLTSMNYPSFQRWINSVPRSERPFRYLQHHT